MKLFHEKLAPNGRSFDKDHADRLLKMKNNGGWTDKKPQVDDNSGSTRKVSKSSEQGSSTETD